MIFTVLFSLSTGPWIERRVGSELEKRRAWWNVRPYCRAGHRLSLRPELGAAHADRRFQLLFLLYQRCKLLVVLISGEFSRTIQRQPRYLRRCIFQIIEQLLIFLAGMLPQRSKASRYRVQHSTLTAQDRCSCQIARARIMRSESYVQRDGLVQLLWQAGKVSAFLTFGADRKI